jgi:hypothetical protein
MPLEGVGRTRPALLVVLLLLLVVVVLAMAAIELTVKLSILLNGEVVVLVVVAVVVVMVAPVSRMWPLEGDMRLMLANVLSGLLGLTCLTCWLGRGRRGDCTAWPVKITEPESVRVYAKKL